MAGKSKEEGKASGQSMCTQGTATASPSGVQPCTATPKHWIGLKVVDEDGAAVTDVTVHCALDDGTSFSVDMSSVTLQPDGSYKTATVLNAANCGFSIPGLTNVEWWPQGGSAGVAATVTTAPAAVAGDCLLTIADTLKFRNYHSIWDQAQNDTFKVNRPNPNMFAVGDVVNVPDKKDRVENKAVDQTWTLVVKSRKPFKVRLLLVDKDGAPLSGKSWVLKSPIARSGTTGGDGLIEISGLQLGQKAAALEVTMTAPIPPPVPPVVAPPVTPPPYPPVIVVADYLDTMPPVDLTAKVMKWDLDIGGLPPVKVKTGTLARLHNLGFGCDVDSDDPKTARAVKAYQRFYLNNKTGSGLPADIQDDAGTRHDIP